MGIPGFFPWLLSRYPRIVGVKPSAPDNVYVDVNGLIHECCVLPDGSYDLDEARSLERLVGLVESLLRELRPTDLLHLSVDGVAPRAKSNQQRERRYASARARSIAYVESLCKERNIAIDAQTKQNGESRGADAAAAAADADGTGSPPPPATDSPAAEALLSKIARKDLFREGLVVRTKQGWAEITSLPEEGDEVATLRLLGGEEEGQTLQLPLDKVVLGAADLAAPAAPSPHAVWDSNAVTCGTVFMDKCTERLKRWAEEYDRPAGLQILVSGVRSPGEGEHKFVDFIKRERDERSRWYKPNASHVLVSGDTDLLLLALSLHEPNVIVARQNSSRNTRSKAKPKQFDFSYIYASVFREYLVEELVGKINKCHDLAKAHAAQEWQQRALLAVPPLVGVALLLAFLQRERLLPALRRGLEGRRWVLVLLLAAIGLRMAYANPALAGRLGLPGRSARAVAKANAKRIRQKQGALLELDAERVLDDFVMLSTLVGNDFMPHSPAIYAGDFSMSTVLDAYVRTMGKAAATGRVDYLTHVSATSNGMRYALNRGVMSRTFRELSRVERGLMSRSEGGGDWRTTYYDSVFDTARDALALSAGGRPELAVESAEQMKRRMCSNYIEGMCFMAVYYLSPDVASWEWCYRMYYAPSCQDLADYLDSNEGLSALLRDDMTKDGSILSFPHDGTQPLRPSQQLVVVLPPASFPLIPEEDGSRAVALRQRGIAFHPAGWRVDSKSGGFSSVALLPIVDTPPAAQPVRDSPEWLITDSPTISAGALHHDSGKVHLYHPNSALLRGGAYLRNTRSLPVGTTSAPVIAVRRACYVPWVPPAGADPLPHDDTCRKLVLEFPEKVPYPPVVVRHVRKMFGAAIRSASRVGDKQYEVRLAEVDADRVREMLKHNNLYDTPEKRTIYFDEFLAVVTLRVSEREPLAYCAVHLPEQAKGQPDIRFFDLQDLFRSDIQVTPAGMIRFFGQTAVVSVLQKDVPRVVARLSDCRTRIVKGRKVTIDDPQADYPTPAGSQAPVASGAAQRDQHPLDLPLSEFFSTSMTSYQDWLCSKCGLRNFEKHVSCRSCKAARDPLKDLPITLRTGSDKTDHYASDHRPFVETVACIQMSYN